MQPGYMPMGAMPPMVQPPPSAGTARTLVLIALIFQFIGSAIILPFLLILPLFAFAGGFGIILGIALGIGLLIGLFFLYIGYAWVYRRIRDGQYEGARTPALILGILGLIFGGFLTGILYLIAYVKIGDAINESRRPAMTYAPPYPYTPGAAGPGFTPAAAPVPGMAPAPAVAPLCPRCGRPGTYIAQYGRYYCYTDQQYL